MRAIFYDRQGPADEVLVFGEMPKPRAGAGEVLVRVHASGINPSDIKNRTGFVSKMTFDRVIPHQDGAGTIEMVGSGVPPDRIGQRVWLYEAQTGRAFGTAADYVVVPADNAVPLPDNASFEVGASLGVPAITAHRCLFADGSLDGRRVLVQGGAGAVGSAAILLAKWAGAWVAATVRRQEQEHIAREAGADLVICLRDKDPATEIAGATGGSGVDRIVEVDIAANLPTDLACLASEGVISAYAAGDVKAAVHVPVLGAMIDNAVFRFVYVYKISAEAKRSAVMDITACLRDGAYHPNIGLTLPLEQAVAAHIAVETGGVGKVLLSVAP